MRLKCLSCEALARMVYLCAAQSPHLVDVEMFKLGLHNRPGDLRERLQAAVDAVPAGEYDAIVLGYGVCGQATVGLAARHTPLVIPRAHDCITLYLGDRQRLRTNPVHTGLRWTIWSAPSRAMRWAHRR